MGDVILTGTGNQLDESLNTIKSEFKLLRDVSGKVRRLASFYKLEPHSGVSKIVHNYGRIVARNVADGQDTTQMEDLSDALTTYTPSEVAVKVILAGSTMRRVADAALFKKTGQIMENAYNLKEDSDGCAQFSAFTTAIGAAATSLSPGHVIAMNTRLQVGNSTATPEPAPTPIYGCFHPCQLHVLLGRTIPLATTPAGTSNMSLSSAEAGAAVAGKGTGSWSEDILKKWFSEGDSVTYGGITHVSDANISVDSSDDGYGAVFSKEGLVYVEEVAPTMKTDADDISMRGAIELVLWGSYAFGTYRPGAYGVAFLGDCSLPSA
jgi:hypothetical protein